MQDIYRVKRQIMYLSMFISALAPSVIMIIYPLVGKFPRENLLPVILITPSHFMIYLYGTELSLTMYSRFFGKMRNKYTIQMSNVKHKIGKILLGVVTLYVVSYIPLAAGYFLGIVFGFSELWGSIIMLGTVVVLFGVRRFVSYINFNNH